MIGMLAVFAWHLDGDDGNGLSYTTEEFPYFVSMAVAGAVLAKEIEPRRLVEVVEHIKGLLCSWPINISKLPLLVLKGILTPLTANKLELCRGDLGLYSLPYLETSPLLLVILRALSSLLWLVIWS